MTIILVVLTGVALAVTYAKMGEDGLIVAVVFLVAGICIMGGR